MMRQLIGTLIELHIRQLLVSVDYRHRIGVCGHLSFEELRETLFFGIGRCRIIPGDQLLLPLFIV